VTPPPSLHESENPPAPDSFVEVVRASLPPHAGRSSAEELRDIWSMTWPLVLGQVMANAVPLIDIFMLGSLGTPTLAAVGYASQFLMLAQSSLMAIGSACVALMARAIGAGSQTEARRAFGASVWLALAVTLPFVFVTLLWPAPMMRVLGVEADIIALALPYFRLTLASALPMAIALTYEHAFRAGRDTFGPMLIAGSVSLLKVGLNYVLIFGQLGLPAQGLYGAGLATLISQLTATGLFLFAGSRHAHAAMRLTRADLRCAPEDIRAAFRLALPAVGERFVMNLAMMCYFRFLAGYGVSAIAAYNVGVRILAFTWIPGLGLSVAAATLVAHALGAGDAARARRSGWQATRLGLWIALGLGALFIALRIRLAQCFTDDPAVVRDLDPFILLLGIALPFLVTHFTLAGALRGAGDTVTPLKAAAIGNWLFRVPLGYLFGVVLQLSLPWVWAIMLIDHLARAVWLLWSFHRGHWQRSAGAATPPP
jgi:putative MATE family efflux protein